MNLLAYMQLIETIKPKGLLLAVFFVLASLPEVAMSNSLPKTSDIKGSLSQPSELVIVISMDGMRHDYPDKGNTDSEMNVAESAFAGFAKMQKEGLRAKALIPTFPSNTFPGHLSLATGTTPERHGIIDNKMWDKRLRKPFSPGEAHLWLEAEPIWITAERQGKRAAIHYWLGSEGPWQGRSASYFKAPFKATRTEQSKLKQIAEWMDLPAKQRPNLIMSYWHGADSAGHQYGPESRQVKRQIEKQDKYLQDLQNIIEKRNAWSSTTLIIVSDHGMSDNLKAIDLLSVFEKGNLDPYVKKSNGIAHLNFKSKFKANNGMNQAYAFLNKQKHFDTYYPNDMPAQLSVNHKTRSGDLVLLAKSDYRFSMQGFSSVNAVKDWFYTALRGGHGLDPNHPDMGAIFFARGNNIPKASKLGKVDMIDVAPSIAKLLGIDPPADATGKSIFPLFVAE